jgi:hypothetical protein
VTNTVFSKPILQCTHVHYHNFKYYRVKSISEIKKPLLGGLV